MSTFPDINPSWYRRPKTSFQERLRKGDGFWQINQLHDVDPRTFRIRWDVLDGTELLELEDHFAENKAQEFAFFCFSHLPWTALAVGTGDDVKVTFDLPVKSVEGATVRFDGVAQPTGWTILAGAGPDGQDQVTFDSAPGDGVVITLDTTSSRLLHTVIYSGSVMFDTGWIEAGIHDLSIELEEA